MIHITSNVSPSKKNTNSFLQSSDSSSIYYKHTSQLKYMMPWSMDNFETDSEKNETSISNLQKKKGLLKEQPKDASLRIEHLYKT